MTYEEAVEHASYLTFLQRCEISQVAAEVNNDTPRVWWEVVDHREIVGEYEDEQAAKNRLALCLDRHIAELMSS